MFYYRFDLLARFLFFSFLLVIMHFLVGWGFSQNATLPPRPLGAELRFFFFSFLSRFFFLPD